MNHWKLEASLKLGRGGNWLLLLASVVAAPACLPGAPSSPSGAGGAERASSALVAAAPRPVSALSLSAASVPGGGTVTGTVALSGTAGTTTVSLSVDLPGIASVPASISVPDGVASGTFTIVTAGVSAATTVGITATVGTSSALQHLQVLPANVVTGASAVIADPGCLANTLAANDDGSTSAVTLPSPVNFFGTTYTFFYINNNGNVTFRQPMVTYTPFTITANVPPIIAPFFADVDTRGSGSSPVTYSFGPVQFDGRPAMCVNWLNVGYYNEHFDKLNSFQLLLVDRGDRAPSDFDIVMNYDRIAWETGDASGGVNGFGGTPAGAGYSAGTGDPTQFFQFPGSLTAGALLDSNTTTGLTQNSRGTLVKGRHIFPVHNGGSVGDATITGTVTNSAMQPLVGAPVQVCSVSNGNCVFFTLTSANGQFEATALLAGDYTVTAYPSAGSNGIVQTVPVHLEAGSVQTVNIVIAGPTPPPAGVTLTPSITTGNGLPSVYWHSPLQLRATACAGGTATYTVSSAVGGTTFATGPMTEGPAGTFTATVPPFAPNHGPAHVHIQTTCPAGPTQIVDFDIYIDPSGVVQTTDGGPLAGAIVTILRSDSAAGPFEAIPDGSAAMSPTNRHNPDLTDIAGHFGWDVVSGFYKVRAQATGCTSSDGQPFVESQVLPVPPAITDLLLSLKCPDMTPPVTTAAVSGMANLAGWFVTAPIVSLAATDEAGGSGVASIHYSLSGAQTLDQIVPGASAQVAPAADGLTTLTFSATDKAGNVEAPHTLALSIDHTPPVVICGAVPPVITAAAGGLVAVHINASATDATSGVASVVLSSLTSSVALGAGDVQGFAVGQPTTDGFLRASPANRVYSLTYTAKDVAGNTASCVAQVQVQMGAPPPPPPPTDHVPPACAVSKVVSSPQGQPAIQFTVSDSGSGLHTVRAASIHGGSLSAPAFASGTTSSVVVTATISPGSLAESVSLAITDVGGNQTTCAASLLHLARGAFLATLDGVPASEKTLTFYNGAPGALAVGVAINGALRTLERLRPGQVQSLDISHQLKTGGNNRIAVIGADFGTKWSADVLLWTGGGSPPPHS